MKKVISFLRSMRFGIILLVLIALCSVAGSLIAQGRDISYYAQTYQSFHGVILMLKLYNVFESWYFITLLVLLCLNLTLCSITRLGAVLKSGDRAEERAACAKNQAALDEEGIRLLREFMASKRCKVQPFGEATVYSKHAIGRYGTFLTHLSILLMVIFGAIALYAPQVIDQVCLPGDSIRLDDGARVYVDSFRSLDGGGRLDYTSSIRLELPNGHISPWQDVSVNHPLHFGEYKIYQQAYGRAALFTAVSGDVSDAFPMTEPAVLQVDDDNAILYQALYPSYMEGPDGTIMPFTYGDYSAPIYQVVISHDGVSEQEWVKPGETREVGGVTFTFEEPFEYPSLRIKKTPAIVNILLFADFALMIAALYITFFLQPILLKVDGSGYAVLGPKPEGLRMELQLLLKNHERNET